MQTRLRGSVQEQVWNCAISCAHVAQILFNPLAEGQGGDKGEASEVLTLGTNLRRHLKFRI